MASADEYIIISIIIISFSSSSSPIILTINYYYFAVLLWLCDYYDRQFSVRYTVVDRRMSFSVLSCGG